MNDESLSLGNPTEAEVPTNLEKNQEIPALILAAATDGHTIEQVHSGIKAAAESSGRVKHTTEPEKTPQIIAGPQNIESSPQQLAA
jgi:hypothetical protein